MNKETESPINTSPSKVQIKNAEDMKWVYLGEGVFAKDVSGETLTGYYTNRGFKIE